MKFKASISFTDDSTFTKSFDKLKEAKEWVLEVYDCSPLDIEFTTISIKTVEDDG